MLRFIDIQRYRQTKPSEDINLCCLNDDWSENTLLCELTVEDEKDYECNEDDGNLKALTAEVMTNGCKDDLYLNLMIGRIMNIQ